MEKFKNTVVFRCVVACLLIAGCQTTKSIEDSHTKPIPESFASTKDSTNSAMIDWRQFFSDTTLIDLIEIALKNNLDVLMTLQKIEIARADLKLRKGALLPEISGGGSVAQRRFGRYTMDGAGNRATEITPGQIVPDDLPDYFIGLQTTWEVDIWGKLRNKKKAAFARYLSSIEGKNIVLTNLIAEIAITYYELLSLDTELEIIRETIKLQENALSMVTIQKQAAAANELAVQQFEAQLLNSRALEVEILQRITVSENRINYLLGRFPQPIIRKKSILTKEIPIQVKVGIPSDLLENRPDIKQAEFELMATKADVKSAKKAFYPSFNITGAMGFQAFNTSFLFRSPESIAYTAMGSLAAPIINRNAIQAQFKTAQAKQIEALYQYQKTIINGYIEVYNEMHNIKNLEQAYNLTTKKVTALTQSIEISSELFKTGRANYLEVLITQQNALQSKLELISTKQQQFNASVNIYKALGGGWRQMKEKLTQG
ncbi:MAG: TolC family protein [Candidatus Brocadia sp.]|nr:TolC family protein [Candidatus Brocadia sp.]